MKNDIFNSPKKNILEKENDKNKENININSISPNKFINNNKIKEIDNNNFFYQMKLLKMILTNKKLTKKHILLNQKRNQLLIL